MQISRSEIHPVRFAFVLLMGISFVAFSGCTSQERETPDNAPLSLANLKKAEYRSAYTASGKVRLENGEYREKLSDDYETELVVRLTDHVAFARVDSMDAAAAILRTSPGGGGFLDLALVLKRNGLVRNTSVQFLGDRVNIDTLVFDGRNIRVDMVVHRREDPIGHPTEKATKRFVVIGDSLAAS